MITQSPATIFLADNRSMVQTARQRTFSTLRTSTGITHNLSGLYGFDDAELAAGATVQLRVDKPSYLMLLPVTGDLSFVDCQGLTTTIENGTARIFAVTSFYTLTNPFAEELINYIQVLIQSEEVPEEQASWDFHFNLALNGNKLTGMPPSKLPFKVSIGRFKGRSEGIYALRNTASSFFTFVITGAFEVANILLHRQDGLTLSAVKEIEFEALSDDAILLCIEIFGYPLPHLGNS